MKCYFSKSECTAIGNLQNLTCLMNTSDNQGDLLHYADHCTWFRPLHMRFWYFCAGRRHKRTIQPSCKVCILAIIPWHIVPFGAPSNKNSFSLSTGNRKRSWTVRLCLPPCPKMLESHTSRLEAQSAWVLMAHLHSCIEMFKEVLQEHVIYIPLIKRGLFSDFF